VCGTIDGLLQCDPSSDDNVSHHNGTPETLHFEFATDVVIDTIWLNNNHDGDRSLAGDSVAIQWHNLAGFEYVLGAMAPRCKS
jgi:hypothetical protein